MKLLLLPLLLLSCSPIKYESDIGFLNSAQANSMEYLVRVNGAACKDMDGGIGLCAKRVASDKPIAFKMDAREYAYRFNLQCTSTINSDFSIDIQKEKPLEFSITPEKFAAVKSFTCIGEVFPQDRDQEVSANWSVRVVVVDSAYLPREIIYSETDGKKSYLVMGKHAKYVSVGGKIAKSSTRVKVEDINIEAYSESERMRFNYSGVK